ncbi:hypothetical protein ACOI22_15325 [Glaciecola sp. 2405UD65-10]|uniref:hypothetical protein n=1 Tax=Glaciecola sp. 2405UD65-10 TaxID=3397244 RepID=UPI003B5A1284
MRHFKENIGVIFYKNVYLNAYGKLAIVLILLTITFAFISFHLPSSSFWATPISVFSGLLLIFQLLKSYKEQIQTSFDKVLVTPQAKKEFNRLVNDNTEGFSIVSLPSNSKISYSESLNNNFLSDSKITFHKLEEFESVLLGNWQDSKQKLSKFLVFKSQEPGYLFNEKKVALLSSLTHGKNAVDIGKTSYFTSLITNEAAGKSLISSCRDSSINFNNMLPIKNGNLLDLAASKLSNHIGVTLLGLTKDKHLVFWTQNANAQVSVNRLVATGSGSLDWLDVNNARSDNLLDVVKYGMARELVEESNLNPNLISELCKQDIMVTGFFRWVERGGKPEFVGICNIPVSTAMFHPNTTEVNNQLEGKLTEHPLINSMADLSEVCDSYLNNKLKIGVSLEYLLYQLKQISVDNNSEIYKKVRKFWALK